MKGTKKVISGCLIASMLLPLSGCGKKKASFPTSEEFTNFLKKDMKVDETSEYNLGEEEWEKGFYIETDEFFSPGWVGYKGMHIVNLFRSVAPLYGLKNVVESSQLMESVNHMVSYFSNDVSIDYHDDEDSDHSQSESEYEITYASLITFDTESDALAFFESYMDQIFVQPTEIYEEALDWYKDNTETLFMRQPRCMLKENIKLEPHEVYSLKTLPEDVYSLDKKAGKGHFTYHIEDRWANVADYFRTDDEPEWITFVQSANDLSLQLEGNQVLMLFKCRYYDYVGYEEFYMDRWPEHEFKNREVMGKFYKEFGVTDPEKIKISDDLNLQLVSISKFDRDDVLHLPEIIRTSDEIPER